MSASVENKPAKILKPTEEDEAEKARVLGLWEEDRMTLLSWRPFLGILAMHLDLVPVVDHRCSTACTDGRRIFFNPYFIGNQSPDERIAILAHEIWHCGLLHFSREVGRMDDHEAWNYAIDHEVNSLLQQDGFKLPYGAVLYRDHVGKSAEQIFELIFEKILPIEGMLVDDHYIGRPSGQESGGGGDQDQSGKAGPLFEKDGDGGISVKVDSGFIPRRSDDVWKEWRANMKGAAQRCSGRGVDYSGYAWAVQDILEPKIHWKELLRQFITPIIGSARQWLPPNRRFVTQGLYLPSRRKDQELKIVIAIDTSGSVVGQIVQDFMSELDAIVRTFGAFEITVIQVDQEITSVATYTHEQPFDAREIDLKGGGGTDLNPPFQWVAENLTEPPKALLYMTDGHGPAPFGQPNYPVLWILNDYGVKPANWGTVIRIEDS